MSDAFIEFEATCCGTRRGLTTMEFVLEQLDVRVVDLISQGWAELWIHIVTVVTVQFCRLAIDQNMAT